MHGHIEVVTLLLKQKANVNATGPKGVTAITAAAMMGHTEVVKVLAQSGADINVCDTTKQNALTLAAHGGHLETVRLLLECGACINNGDYYGALHYAAKQNHIHVAKLLLKHGADPNVGKFRRPLLLAANCSNRAMVEALLDSGAQINQYDTTGSTALHLASFACKLDVAKLLVERGANIHLAPLGTSALHLACILGHTEVAQFLIECGGDVNFPRTADNANQSEIISNEGTSLCLAIKGGHASIVKMLLKICDEKHGQQMMKLDQRTKDGNTPLIDAIQCNNGGIVRLLLQHGANVNKKNNFGSSPLSVAAVLGHLEIVFILLEFGALVECRSIEPSLSPLALAAIEGHVEIVKTLASHGADVNTICSLNGDIFTPLIFATDVSNVDMVKTLLYCNVNVSMTDLTGAGALLVAIRTGCLQIVEMLLNYITENSDVSSANITPHAVSIKDSDSDLKIHVQIRKHAIINAANYHGTTPLLYAAEVGFFKIVELLIHHGAVVNMADDDEDTPLHVAAYGGHHNIVSLLLQHNAHIDSRNNNDATPLWCAAEQDHLAVVKILFSQGADVNICEDNGKSIVSIAASCQQIDIVEFLLQLSFPVSMTWQTFTDYFQN